MRDESPFCVLKALVLACPSLRRLYLEGDWSTTIQAPQLLASSGSLRETEDALDAFLLALGEETRIEHLFLTTSSRSGNRSTTTVTFDADRQADVWV